MLFDFYFLSADTGMKEVCEAVLGVFRCDCTTNFFQSDSSGGLPLGPFLEKKKKLFSSFIIL